MRVLVTSGATREPIDAVRFLSNGSTGETGARIADALVARGHRVTLLHGIGAVLPSRVRDSEGFSSAADLGKRLRARLASGSYDAVIMAAAVADYRPAREARGKLSSERAALTLRLVRIPKLLPRLKRWAPRPLLVIGFKLTAGADAASRTRAVEAQLRAGGVDGVVHNDLDQRSSGSAPEYRVFRARGGKPQRLIGTPALAGALEDLLAERSPLARRRGSNS
jgi:phosphopantothenoylcysteine synthetase/decarboxylase